MTPSNALPTQEFAFQRPSSGYANALPAGFHRLPTVCVPAPHTPSYVGRVARGSTRCSRLGSAPPVGYARSTLAYHRSQQSSTTESPQIRTAGQGVAQIRGRQHEGI
jgi:hypothetical protein